MKTQMVRLALVLVLAPAPAMAQSATATLTGVVKDTSSALLPGATVTLRNVATNETRSVPTAGEGSYRVSSLPRGEYEVTATLQGFKRLTQSGVLLTVGEIVRLDFTLEVGDMVETVQVIAENRLLNVEEGRLSYLVDEKQVNELPLNGRNAFQLMELQPGAVANSGSVGPFGGGQAAGNTAFMNGQRNRANNFLLDGIDNNDQFTAGRVALNPNVDMIQEFRVSANNFSAEFGRNSAAAITVVTKSGSNDFHGTAYDFFRHDALNARSIFTTQKEALRYNQFGGTTGGPITRNRFFFFASYEGLRSRRGSTGLQTVETPEFRRLVAERYPNSIANYLLQHYPSPTPTQNLRDTGQPVAGLSQDHIDNTPSLAGNPNYVSTGGGFYSNSRQGAPDGIPDLGTAVVPLTGHTESDQVSLRLDTELSPTQRVFGRYIYDRKSIDRLEGEARSARFTRPGRPRTDHIALGHTWIASNRIVSETRFGLNRLDMNFDQRDPGVPIMTFNDGSPGFGSAIILSTFVDTYQWTNTMSMSLGNHGVKIGGEYRYVRDDVDGPTNRPSLTFANIHDFAQDEVFFIGSIGVDPRSGHITSNVRNFRYNEVGFFAQDDWKLRSNLTANVGLRYEWFGRPTEKNGLLGTIIPGPGSDLFEMVRTGTVGAVDAVMQDDYNNFGPRLGLSWHPGDNGRLVARGGYGLMYERLFNNSPENVRLNPPFYALTSAQPVFTAAHRGIPIAYGPTNPDGSRNVNEPLRTTGPNNNLGVAPDSGVIGNLVGWNPRFGTSTQSLRVPDLFGRDSYSHNWFAGAQLDLGGNLGVEANYVGNLGRNLGRLVDYNTRPGDIFDGRLDRLNPSFGGINYRAMNARSEYHALQLQLRRRQAQGFSGQISYTLGKAMDDDSDIQLSRFATDARNFALDWGASDFDVRHRVVANWLWELPFFTGASGLKRSLLGGWQVNGIVQYQTGYPFNVFTSAPYPNGDFNGDGVLNDRPNLPTYGVEPASTSNEAYMSGFLRVADFPRPQGTPGNLPRNAYRGPRYTTTDLSLFKSFALSRWQDARIQLRVEAFNLFNTVNLRLPGFNGDLNSGLFARATSAFPAREVQFALKVIY